MFGNSSSDKPGMRERWDARMDQPYPRSVTRRRMFWNRAVAGTVGVVLGTGTGIVFVDLALDTGERVVSNNVDSVNESESARTVDNISVQIPDVDLSVTSDSITDDGSATSATIENYIVQPGDTYYEILARKGMSQEAVDICLSSAGIDPTLLIANEPFVDPC